MNKMIKYFKVGVDCYVRNMREHNYFRVTGDCTPIEED